MIPQAILNRMRPVSRLSLIPSAKKHRVKQRYLRYNTLRTPHRATHRTAGRQSSRLTVDLSAARVQGKTKFA